MKTITFYLVLSFVTVALISSCEKDSITKRCCSCERPASEQGANTMSFKINGEQWSNCNKTDDGSLNDFRTVMVQLPYGDYRRMDVLGNRNFEGSAYESFYIHLIEPKIGYLDNSPHIPLFRFYTNKSTKYSSDYFTDSTKAYFLNITKVDWENRILSGVFECELKEAPGGAGLPNLKITNGRFDVSF